VHVMRLLLSFLLPGAAVLLAAFGLVRWDVLDEWVPAIDRGYPAIMLIVGVLVGWRFHRSKLVFGVLSLVVLDRALFVLGGDTAASKASAEVAWAVVALLLPISLAAVVVVQEKGLLSVHGVCRASLVFLLWPIVFVLSRYPHMRICQWLQEPVFRAEWLEGVPIPQPALIAFAIALLVAFIVYVRRRSAFENGFFWALVAALCALVARGEGAATTIYFSTGALILVVSALEVSFGMAFRDELTGLPARRAMNESLLRLGGTYCLAMADIDYFKKFNDHFGHDVGDQVLRMVASHLGRVGGRGKVYRYGGEEFAVIFAGKNKKDAKPHLDHVRQSVEDLEFTIRAGGRPRTKPEAPKEQRKERKTVQVTISIGVADSAKHPDEPLAVLRNADKALYRAKRDGRNRVSF